MLIDENFYFLTIQLIPTRKSFMVVIGRDVLDSKLKLEVMVMLCKTVVFIASHLLIFNEKLTGL